MLFVVGAKGKTGSAIVRSFAALGSDVRGISHVGEIAEIIEQARETQAVDVVYPAVSSTRPYTDDEKIRDLNSLGDYIAAFKSLGRKVRFVFFSSIALYEGMPTDYCDPTYLPTDHHSPYSAGKAEAELLLRSGQSDDFRVGIIRSSALLSDFNFDETFLASAAGRASRGETFSLSGPGNKFNACFPRHQLAEFLLKVFDILGQDSRVFSTNLGCANPVLMSDVARLICDTFSSAEVFTWNVAASPTQRVLKVDDRLQACLPDTFDVLRGYFGKQKSA